LEKAEITERLTLGVLSHSANVRFCPKADSGVSKNGNSVHRHRLNSPKPLFIKNAQDCFQVASALQDISAARNNTKLALLVSKGWRFFDAVKRLFASAAKDREYGSVDFKVQRIVFPMASADHLSIDIQDRA